MGLDDAHGYLYEENKAKQYEALSHIDMQDNKTEIAYRDLNSRFELAEKKNFNGEELAARQRAHREKKQKIEDAWHKNTSQQKKNLEKRAKKGSASEAEYYKNFTLEELEVFIKNSDRGGNSALYNDVATDLEVYNRVMSAEFADANEGLTLLKRLQESCNNYLRERKRTFWRTGTGKIRRAIIESISIKVNQSIEQQSTKIFEESVKAKKAYKEDRTDEKVEKAMKANYDLVYQVLNGNMELTKEQITNLDSDMEELITELMKNKVDETQSDSLSSKFFNALGWSGSKARIVDPEDLNNNGNAMKTSPIKKKMFHSMNPIGNAPDANDLADQLAGTKEKDNKIYYGLGRFGKGIYTSTMNENETSSEKLAYNNSWNYGDKAGASMVIMTLNEYARVVTQAQLLKKIETLNSNFPKLYNAITKNEHASKGGYLDYFSVIAALFGYNTIKGPSGVQSRENKNGLDDVDYYTTTDRKALTISRDVEVRTKDKDENEKEISFLDIDTYKLGSKNANKEGGNKDV